MGDKGIIYILGPMRGYENLNFDAFNKAEEMLIELGWTVFNPARNPDGLKSPKAYIMIDIMALMECDAVLRLKGWDKSDGANVENALAKYLNLAIIDEKDLNHFYEAFA